MNLSRESCSTSDAGKFNLSSMQNSSAAELKLKAESPPHIMNSKKATIPMTFLLAGLSWSAVAGERFASTTGTVRKELSADRVSFTLQVKATDKTVEASIAKLERLLADLFTEANKLKYSSNAFSIKTRATAREWEWDDKKKTSVGFTSSASVSVILTELASFGKLLTFLGTTEGFEVLWVSLASSAEGEARKQVIAEALRAARAKAALLAEEGGAKLGRLLEVTEEEVETRSLSDYPSSANAPDPNEGKGIYPIGIYVRVRAKFEIK